VLAYVAGGAKGFSRFWSEGLGAALGLLKYVAAFIIYH
jgi:hypothetical protein